MYLSDEWKQSDLNSVPSEPIWGCNIISLISLKGFLSVHATKKEDAGNLQEKVWLHECATCDKRFPYLYTFKDCQICTSVMNDKSFLIKIDHILTKYDSLIYVFYCLLKCICFKKYQTSACLNTSAKINAIPIACLDASA